jgi:hypothetical protein
MTRPTQARVAAGDLRLPASQARTSCGFCAATYGQPGTCQHLPGRRASLQGDLAGFRQEDHRQPRWLLDLRLLGGQARHLAGSMCRLAVQSVLARPSWNISALARALAAAATASSRSISRAQAAEHGGVLPGVRAPGLLRGVPESPHSEAGQIVDAGHGEPRGGGMARGRLSTRRDPGAGSGRGSARRAACRVTVRWLIPSPSWPSWPATCFTPRSWAARLSRRSRGWPSAGASQPLDACHRRKVWPVTSVTARVPGETTGSLARSDSLLFAPPVSGFRAVNVQLNW